MILHVPGNGKHGRIVHDDSKRTVNLASQLEIPHAPVLGSGRYFVIEGAGHVGGKEPHPVEGISGKDEPQIMSVGLVYRPIEGVFNRELRLASQLNKSIFIN